MAAPRIRANFDELNKIAQDFKRAADLQQGVVQTLKQHVEVLRGGD